MHSILFRSALTLALAPLAATAQTATPIAAAPVPGCLAMEVGPVYDASLADGTTLACFQFVTPEAPAASKLDVNLAGFRAGELHNVGLVRVDADGSTHTAATDTSMDTYRILQSISGASTRWLLLVGRPAAGNASPFQMQVTLAQGADRYEPNDGLAMMTTLEGNRRIEGSLDNAADVDNFSITFRPDQKAGIVELEAPAGVVGIIIDGAKKTGKLRGGSTYRIDTSKPVFVQIKGDASTVGARYALALRDPKAVAVVSIKRSKENISHLAPAANSTVPGGANVARTMEVEATVFEGDGVTPAGAGYIVEFSTHDRDGGRSWDLASAVAVTDAHGVARTTLDIGACKGGATGPLTVPTYGSPPDFWDIEYNPESVVMATIRGGDPVQTTDIEKWSRRFQHICKETFRKHRPWHR